MMQFAEISNEYHFYKFKQGIKIVRPVKDLEEPQSTIHHLFSHDFNVYWVNNDYSLNKINESCAAICGFDAPRIATGKTAFDFADHKSAILAQQSDYDVLSSKQLTIRELDLTLKNEDNVCPHLTIKQPCYNEKNQLMGLLGCSITYGVHSLSSSLNAMIQLGLLNQENSIVSALKQDIFPLSAQQKRCAQYLLDGLAIKSIAKQMNLSPRTIETHINTMKLKLFCQNRTELLLKLYELFIRFKMH